MRKKLNRAQTEEIINLRVWKDPAFKKKLLASPREALEELGMENIPASLNIEVVEETPRRVYVVLHTPPPNARNLSDEELKRIAAASPSKGCGGFCG